MSVAKRIRARLASSISKIEETETFLWGKVLHACEPDYREIEEFSPASLVENNLPLVIEVNGKISTFEFYFKKAKTLTLSHRRLILKSKTNPVFFGFGNISVSNFKVSFDKELKLSFAAKIIVEGTPFYLKTKEQRKKRASDKLTSKIIKTGIVRKNINYIIEAPEIIDCLSTLKPKIYNMELLSRLEHNSSSNSISNKKIDLLDNPRLIKRIDQNELKFGEELFYSPFEFDPQIKTGELSLYSDVFPWNTKQVKIKIPQFDYSVKTKLSFFYESDSSSPVNKEESSKRVSAEVINKIIQPKTDLSPDEEKKLFEKLYQYQIKGIKLLTSNTKVLLSNEPGLGKTIQAIFAIKYLIKKREMKSALVVVDENSTGSVTIAENTGSYSGWIDQLKRFAPELSNICTDLESVDLKTELAKTSQVQVITYKLLSNAVKQKILQKEILKKFDCVVFDDAENLKIYQNECAQIINFVKPKFNWIITRLTKEQYSENILPQLKHDVFLSHNFNEVRQQMPEIMESNYWIDLEKDHRSEFDQTLFHARNSLQEILETGNPFRFQSQLFFYVHQLKQVCNFSSDNMDSNKTKLLLSHVNSLKSFNKRVIVFSQYDKAGIQKLARLLEKEKISYKKYSQGMTPGELSKAISEFEQDASISVFLADSQVMKAKSHKVYAPYVIHFDQWWAPVARWDLENKINNSSNRPITVLNYFTKKTLDEKIQSELSSKKMLDRKSSGKVGANAYSKIISEDEWISIFELEKITEKPEEKKEEGNDAEDI